MDLENNNLLTRLNHGFDDSRKFFDVSSCFLCNPVGTDFRESMYNDTQVSLTLGCVSFGLGSGEFVGLTTSGLYLGLFTETGGFGKIWG